MHTLKWLCILVMLTLASPYGRTELLTYMDGGIGLGIHTLHDDDDNAAATKVVKLGGGVQLLPFLSAGVALYSWGVVQDNQNEDAVNFDGISSGWELLAHIPFSLDGLPPGPYLRYGGHCWAATITGLAQPWAKEGCSDLTAVGLALSGDNRRSNKGVFYAELSRTRFDEVTSGSIIAGIRSSF